MKETYLLVLRNGGSREYQRPWVIQVKSFGIIATLHDETNSTKIVTKLVHPWHNVMVFKQTVQEERTT